ncbi:AAA family ATPase, partial [Acinetobacter baumannii]
PGGCLEINDQTAANKFLGNTWSAWSETTPRYRKFIDAILQTDMHIISTTRAKTETVQGENKKIMKLGMKAEQRDGYEYE